MNWWPMHSWHPVVVHLPLVGLVLAVAFDLVAGGLTVLVDVRGDGPRSPTMDDKGMARP